MDDFRPTIRQCCRIAFLALLVPVVLSMIGPAYFGYRHEGYKHVVLWALVASIGYLFWGRQELKNVAPGPILFLVITATVILGFLAGDSLAYFIARAL